MNPNASFMQIFVYIFTASDQVHEIKCQEKNKTQCTKTIIKPNSFVCVVYMRWDWLHPESTTQTNFLHMSAAHEIVQQITTYFIRVLRSALRARK